jgi:hypothetical protein
LVWVTALNLSRPPDRLIQYTAWFELTKAHKGGKLGTTTFTNSVKRKLALGSVRKVGDFYQVVGPLQRPMMTGGSIAGREQFSAGPGASGRPVPSYQMSRPRCGLPKGFHANLDGVADQESANIPLNATVAASI